MSISDYVKMHDIDGMNEHYRKAIRSLLKLHSDVVEAFFEHEITLIDAMILAWLPHKQQLEWLSTAIGGDNELVNFVKEEPSS